MTARHRPSAGHASVGGMQTLIAEDLLLLLLDDEKGTLAASDKVRPLVDEEVFTSQAR